MPSHIERCTPKHLNPIGKPIEKYLPHHHRPPLERDRGPPLERDRVFLIFTTPPMLHALSIRRERDRVFSFVDFGVIDVIRRRTRPKHSN
jgi:hypothetical protein